MTSMKLALTLLTATASALLLAGAAPGRDAPRGPIVTVLRHGGLCSAGRDRPGVECRFEIRIGDRSVVAGSLVRRLPPARRAELLRAIGALELRAVRAHPFRGTCPTAYDGQESVYSFRGFRQPLASCTYDLRRVRAVQLTERLLASLGIPGG